MLRKTFIDGKYITHAHITHNTYIIHAYVYMSFSSSSIIHVDDVNLDITAISYA